MKSKQVLVVAVVAMGLALVGVVVASVGLRSALLRLGAAQNGTSPGTVRSVVTLSMGVVLPLGITLLTRLMKTPRTPWVCYFCLWMYSLMCAAGIVYFMGGSMGRHDATLAWTAWTFVGCLALVGSASILCFVYEVKRRAEAAQGTISN